MTYFINKGGRNVIENIRLSFQGIWSHKMRSFLTMLGIIIGIAAIITIVSTIKGTNEQIKRNLIGGGNNTVDIKLYQEEWPYEMEYNGIPENIPVISDDKLNSIMDNEYIVKASKYHFRNVYDGIYYGNNSLSGGQINGIDKDYFSTCNYRIIKGRGFTSDDFSSFRKVVIIDGAVAESLFTGTSPIGKTIEIKGEPFTVIGLVEKADKFEPVINSEEDYWTYSQQNMSMMFIPDSVWPIVYSFDEPESIVAKATSTEDMAKVGKLIADKLNVGLPEDAVIKYKGENVLEQAKQLQELSTATNHQLVWIASISLLVGGIGVMNIMLVSVTERTKEIGLKKAIGAPKKKILYQFLTESAVLTSVGGLFGVIVGIVLSKVVSKISQAPVAISIPAIIISVGFSMIIGIIFGLLPSVKASNLNPIDALRYE